MRSSILLFLLLAMPSLVWAQTPPPKPPQNLQPLPAVPPPPPDIVPFDDALEPQITIRKNDKETVEEYRISGQLYMIKVTPLHGAPYYLVDNQGEGRFIRMESLDQNLRVPQWLIKTF